MRQTTFWKEGIILGTLLVVLLIINLSVGSVRIPISSLITSFFSNEGGTYQTIL